MSTQHIPRTVGAPVAAGLTAAALSVAFSPSGSARILGVTMPLPLVAGITVGAASGITEMVKNHVVPAITNDPFSMTASHVVQPAVTGAANVLTVGLLAGFDTSKPMTTLITSAFTVGAGSQLVANYAGDTIDRFVMGLLPSGSGGTTIVTL